MADCDSNPLCSICIEEFIDSAAGDNVLNCVRTPCNHHFHRHCIMMWLNRPGIGTCPNCRKKPLHQRDLVPVEKPYLATSRLQPLHQRDLVPVPAQQPIPLGWVQPPQPHDHQRDFAPLPVEHPLLGTSSGYNIKSTIWKWLSSGFSILTRCWNYFKDDWEWFLLGVLCSVCSFLLIYAVKKTQEAKPPIHGLPIERLPIERLPIEKLPIEKLPIERLPIEKLPIERLPIEKLPIERLPIERVSYQGLPPLGHPLQRNFVQRLPFPKRPVQRFLFLQRLSNRFEKYGLDKIDSWHAY